MQGGLGWDEVGGGGGVGDVVWKHGPREAVTDVCGDGPEQSRHPPKVLSCQRALSFDQQRNPFPEGE